MNCSRNSKGNKQLSSLPLRTASLASEAEPCSSNLLLAGYMAYEFLTKGTLMGQNFNSSRPRDVVPISAADSEKKPRQLNKGGGGGGGSSSSEGGGGSRGSSVRASPGYSEQNHVQRYDEVATLLKMEGAHIPDVVNPAQLSGWVRR